MPSPYSADLRERVLLADAAGLSPAVVAAPLWGRALDGICGASRRARRGGAAPSRMAAGGRGIDPAGEAILWGLVAGATIARWTNIASC